MFDEPDQPKVGARVSNRILAINGPGRLRGTLF